MLVLGRCVHAARAIFFPVRMNSGKMQGRPIMKALVVFYSIYGHVYKMAEAIAEG